MFVKVKCLSQYAKFFHFILGDSVRSVSDNNDEEDECWDRELNDSLGMKYFHSKF